MNKPIKFIFVLIASLLLISNCFANFPHYINSSPQYFNPNVILKAAVSPYKKYSDGYGNPGASGLGYINVLKLETGIVKKDMDPTLDGIVSYDRAESNGAYIGQINMLAASSFNGVNGLVWGYDLARAPKIASQKPLFHTKQKGRTIPVYSMTPLLDAGKKLFGTATNPVFPIIPGAMVRSAIKSSTAVGPTYIWSALALSIAKDRTKSANLFMEDAGHIRCKSMTECKNKLNARMKKLALSAIRCGNDAGVAFAKIFVAYTVRYVPAGYVGTAITAAPYITLPKNALPKNKIDILKMSIQDWQNLTRKHQKPSNIMKNTAPILN